MTEDFVELIKLIILADFEEAPLQFHCKKCRGTSGADVDKLLVDDYYNRSEPTYWVTLSLMNFSISNRNC